MTPEMEDRIITLVANSTDGLSKLCRINDDLPDPATVRRHIVNSETFCNRYARAKEEQADVMAEEIVSIADELEERDELSSEMVAAARLRVDARKWIASKLKPKKYGEKLDVDHSGAIGINWHEEKTYEAKPETNTGN